MSEIDKLEEYLKTHGYNYERIKDKGTDGAWLQNQVIVYDDNGERLWDAVCNIISGGYKKGLLEVMGSAVVRCDDEVEGWLTADDIIKRLEGQDG